MKLFVVSMFTSEINLYTAHRYIEKALKGSSTSDQLVKQKLIEIMRNAPEYHNNCCPVVVGGKPKMTLPP